jgi:LPS export ABC transporter protein LptC
VTQTLLRTAVTGLALSGLATLGLLLHSRTDTPDASDNRDWPDFYVEHARWREFDRDGRLSRELHAARVAQWPDETLARLSAPRLRVTDALQRQWRAGAQHGWVPQDRHELVLEGDVRLVRERS